MKNSRKIDEGRSATPSTDKKKRRISLEPAPVLSETEQRQRAAAWAKRQENAAAISEALPPVRSPARAAPAPAAKPVRGRKAAAPEPASPPAAKELAPRRGGRKAAAAESESESEPAAAPAKRKYTKRSDKWGAAASAAEESSSEEEVEEEEEVKKPAAPTPKKTPAKKAAPVKEEAAPTPKKDATPAARRRSATVSKEPQVAGSAFLPSPAAKTESSSSSAAAEAVTTHADSNSSNWCAACTDETCGNVHVVVGIVLLSWFIALFVDGTVGASCLVVAVIISSLRRLVDWFCDSCASKSEQTYTASADPAARRKSD